MTVEEETLQQRGQKFDGSPAGLLSDHQPAVENSLISSSDCRTAANCGYK